jgi:SHS2 domain-containing protein
MKTYEIIDHTADLGLRVYGRTVQELFLNAAWAMFEVMVETIKKESIFHKQERKKFLVNKPGSNLEEVLIAWLSELLYLFSAEGLIMEKADLQRVDQTGIQAEIAGRIFSPDFFRIKTEIKAVTYHELDEAQVIFYV